MELHLKECPFCGGEVIRDYVNNSYYEDISCHTCGESFRMSDEAWNTRPQSLTEKVKWPDKLKKCDAIYHSSDCECAEIEAYNKAIDLCKQSLNQASEEDREKLANRFQKFDILAEDILEGKTFCVLSLEKCYEIADALKKEYILIKREK